MSQEIVNLTYINSIDQPVLIKFTEQGLSGYSGGTGVDGLSGYSGWSGGTGVDGVSGYSGWSGISGFSGSSGWSGYSGESAWSGYSGTSGISGYSGESAWSGYSGTSGFSGYSGVSGFSGISGFSGTSGISGYSGWSGASGFSGTAVSTTGTSGYVPYFTSPTAITNSNVFYDDVNGRIGLGITAPTAQLHVKGQVIVDAASSQGLQIDPYIAPTGDISYATCLSAMNYNLVLGNSAGVGGYGTVLRAYSGAAWRTGLEYLNQAQTYPDLLLQKLGGNVGIGISAPTAQLHLVKADSSALTDFLINPTLKTSGNLLDLQVGGVSKAYFEFNSAYALDQARLILKSGAYLNTYSAFSYNLIDTQNNPFTFCTRSADLTFEAGYGTSFNKFIFQNYGAGAGAFTNTSGTNAYINITPTYNQATGTAANTDLLINRTQTAVGSGAQLLIDAQVGSASKFKVDNTGKIFSPGVDISTAGSSGRNLYTPGYLTIENAQSFIIRGLTTSYGGDHTQLQIGDQTQTNTAGNRVVLNIVSSYNQASGTSANTDLLISRTQTAVGSGAQLLIDAQVGSVSKFKVTNTGAAVFSGRVDSGGFQAFASYIQVDNGYGLVASDTNRSVVVGAVRNFTNAGTFVRMTEQTFSNTTGSSIAVSILPTYNQLSGAAANTDLLINRTQTAVGSGAQLLIDAQVGGVSKFNISNTGRVFLAAGTAALPSISFIDNPDTGIWYVPTNILIGVDGTEVFRAYANKAIYFGGTGAGSFELDPTTTTINATTAGATLQLNTKPSGTAGSTKVLFGNSTDSQTSGTNTIVSITPTYNQATGTAANTDLLINRTQTAVGSGAQLLIDAQVGSVSKFYVDNTGLVKLDSLIMGDGKSIYCLSTGYGAILNFGTDVLRLQKKTVAQADSGTYGAILIQQATNVLPAFSFAGDINTGVGTAGADQLSLIAGGVEGARVTATEFNVTKEINIVTYEEDVICYEGEVVFYL